MIYFTLAVRLCEVSSVKKCHVKCHLLAGLSLLLVLTGCLPVTRPVVVRPSATPVPATETPAPTTIWFPTTPTFTPLPTVELLPTPQMRPDVGELFFQDDFSDETAWMLWQTAAGSVAMGKDDLTIVIHEEKVYMYSVRLQPVFTDFYLELTANTNFCRGKDEYGLLLRVSPDIDYYRFSLSCDGNVRLDRLYQGRTVSPQATMLSGAAPQGAPGQVRLGVWALKDEMRFFINDLYQFTVKDGTLLTGGVGVYALSSSAELLSVYFSDLKVYQLVDEP